MNDLKTIRREVDLAIKNRKTFTMVSYWPSVQKLLEDRGWVEKLHPNAIGESCYVFQEFCKKSIEELATYLNNNTYTIISRRIIKSKLLLNHQVDLVLFNHNFLFNDFRFIIDKDKIPLVNKFNISSEDFTMKSGLCKASKMACLHGQDSSLTISHPRSYVLKDEWDLFWEDFNITSAISLLKYIDETYKSKTSKILSPFGQIPFDIFKFALSQCKKFIERFYDQKYHKNKKLFDTTPNDWDNFHNYFVQMVHFSNHFKQTSNDDDDDDDHVTSEHHLVTQARKMLSKLSLVNPNIETSGYHNIWILKPVNDCRGQGIFLSCSKDNILHNIGKQDYVAQKYIERPLLIFDTKFDIRQWFLITNNNPLTIWMWKDCYLRFSSQTFSLRKLHKSIHLTGNCMQAEYMQNLIEDSGIPEYLMWSSEDFRQYLSDIGYPDVYSEIIYPEMKRDLISISIIYKNTLGTRRNCFQLYGADFMIASDFKPWLLELNYNPDLSCNNPVTRKLVPQVLDDIIRVALDYKENKEANVGAFELIYEEPMSKK